MSKKKNHKNQLLSNADITKLKKIKSDLDVVGKRFNAVLEGTLDGFWIVDRKGHIVEVNETYCRLSGYSHDELIKMHINDLDALENEKITKKRIQKVIEKGSDLFESTHRRKDGALWSVEVSISYSDLEGGCFFTFLRDITDRKNKERILALRHELSEMIFGATPNELLRAALDACEKMTASQIGFFHFVDRDEDTVSLQTWSTRTLKEMCFAKGEGLHYPVSEAGVWVDCIRQRKPIIHNDYPSLPHKKGMPDGHPPLLRELTVPIFRKKKVVAVVGVGNKQTAYDERDLELVSEISDIAYEYCERKKAEEQVKFMAYNDMLTSLPNRQLFADRLKQAISLSKRTGQIVAVCFLDLDGFKPINDQFGHGIGDQLLRDLASRLQAELREGDTLARLGGDEFALVLCGLTSIDDGEEVVRRLLHDINQPFVIDGHRLRVSASIGMTTFPQDRVDADSLLRHADHAMYKAKEAGKNRFELYRPIREHKVSKRLEALNDFKKALLEQELCLNFQPRIALKDGALAGVEVLVRWHHPKKGLLLPGQFLPLIENTTYEIELDEWVIKAALEEHMNWREQNVFLPISINVTPRHIQQESFVAFLKETLAKYPADLTDYLELEVLETAAIHDTAAVSRIMGECAKMGIKFSLDDFGTGYSSLTYFHQLPVEILKIDQNFVRDMLENPADQRIVEGVLKLAETLRCPVVAEGVETEELGLLLYQLGCQYAQGFGIAKPMGSEDLIDWMAGRKENDFWSSLSNEAYRCTSQHLLNVVIFTHHKWLQAVLDHVASGFESPCPVLEAEKCSFTPWYHGVGLEAYAHKAHYPFILAKHDLMHDLGARYIDHAKNARNAEAAETLSALENIAEEVFAMLKKLEEV